MSENMSFWDKISRPPQSALKEIKGGRMNGKTDISPMWRIQAMTELFGPCGTGWRYAIDKLWTEPGEGGNVTAFALVSVAYQSEGVWSEPIPGIGGSMLVAKESGGYHTSDEAYKMAVTDALSVALKALGMAADVYLGKFDGSKYKDAPPASPKSGPEPPKPPAGPKPIVPKDFQVFLTESQDVVKLEAMKRDALFELRVKASGEDGPAVLRLLDARIAELKPATPAAAQAVLGAFQGAEVAGTRPAFAGGKASGEDKVEMPFPFGDDDSPENQG